VGVRDPEPLSRLGRPFDKPGSPMNRFTSARPGGAESTAFTGLPGAAPIFASLATILSANPT